MTWLGDESRAENWDVLSVPAVIWQRISECVHV